MQTRFFGVAMLAWCVGCGDDSQSTGGGGGGNSGGQTNQGGSSGTAGAPSNGGAAADGGFGVGGAPPGQCDNGPLASPIPGCAPVPPASTGDPHEDCVVRINQFRFECQCLPPLARWTEAEGCTDDQSADDQQSGAAHGNFGACGEFAQNTCPDWPSETDVVGGCLQLMWDEGPGEPFEAHGHYINMSNTGYTKVACGFSTGPSGTWSNQNFSP